MEGMERLKEFYKGKNILITGHTGFKGTWITSILQHFGANISGFALPNSETGFYKSAGLKVDSFWGDIRDKEKVADVVRICQPDIIIHLASHSTVNKGQELTHYIFETNGMGVVNLFEAVRQVSSVQSVLVVTSDKSYRNLETQTPYTEESMLGAQDPYSTSKAIQELITECYRTSFFRDYQVRIATARASNVIGGGDFNRTRLFPSLIDSFLKGETASIRNPHAVRPWQNVLDVLCGYLLLAKALYEKKEPIEKINSAFNFGPNEDGFITVEQAALMLLESFPSGYYEISGTNQVIETNILKLDSNKAKELLDWEPIYSINETIEMTAEFEKQFISGVSAQEICETYIRQYFGG